MRGWIDVIWVLCDASKGLYSWDIGNTGIGLSFGIAGKEFILNHKSIAAYSLV